MECEKCSGEMIDKIPTICSPNYDYKLTCEDCGNIKDIRGINNG